MSLIPYSWQLLELIYPVSLVIIRVNDVNLEGVALQLLELSYTLSLVIIRVNDVNLEGVALQLFSVRDKAIVTIFIKVKKELGIILTIAF